MTEPTPPPSIVRTVGHSTRTLEELLEILTAHEVTTLVDVRSYPRSRRHPQFDRDALAASLPHAGLRYDWLGAELGGLRKFGQRGSPHRALSADGFRPYADHMETPTFAATVDLLLAHPPGAAVLCAERLWRHCHRALLADYLAGVRGVDVVHLIDARSSEPHRLSSTARVDGDRLVYDVGVDPDAQLSLFGGG